jgi:hypothetical protein
MSLERGKWQEWRGLTSRLGTLGRGVVWSFLEGPWEVLEAGSQDFFAGGKTWGLDLDVDDRVMGEDLWSRRRGRPQMVGEKLGEKLGETSRV